MHRVFKAAVVACRAAGRPAHYSVFRGMARSSPRHGAAARSLQEWGLPPSSLQE
jgi:hypothetical protein